MISAIENKTKVKSVRTSKFLPPKIEPSPSTRIKTPTTAIQNRQIFTMPATGTLSCWANPAKILAVLIFILPIIICKQTASAAENQSVDELLFQNQTGKIFLAISLQWEGLSLTTPNIDAIIDFRKKFSSISMFQFINPAYFTKPGVNTNMAAEKIASVIRPHDTIGLQLLGWKSLITAAGIPYRNTPTFWGNTIKEADCIIDCGHEVPINSYSRLELSTLIKFGSKLLSTQGFRTPKAMMAGGWMAGNNVLEAAVDSGLRFDFSGVPPHLLQKKIGKYPIYSRISDLWGQTTAFSQPVSVPTRAGWITEVFNNAASLDYVTSKEIVDLYKGYTNLQKNKPSQNFVIHISFYQETAMKNLPKLEYALQEIFAHSHDNDTSIQMLKLHGSPVTSRRSGLDTSIKRISNTSNTSNTSNISKDSQPRNSFLSLGEGEEKMFAPSLEAVSR